MTPRPKLLGLALGIVLGLALAPVPAMSDPPSPDPAALPLGDAPAVAWQSGASVHLANGKTRQLPKTIGPASAIQVLGRRGGEYLVVVPGNEPKVVAVKGSKTRTVWRHGYDESGTYYYLAAKGSVIAEANYTRSASTYIEIFDLKGKKLAHQSFDDNARILDFEGDTALLDGEETTRWVVPGPAPVPVAPSAFFGDLDSDLLFVDDAKGFVGPTSLSAPGTPPWTAKFRPLALSPDGAWIAGWNMSYTPRLEVRSVATGALAAASGMKVVRDGVMTWEPDGALLVEVKTTKGRALVRCTVTGKCERATPWVKGQHLSFLS